MNGNKESFGVLITFSCEHIYKCAQRSAHQSFVSMQKKMVFPVDIFNLKKRELNLVQEILLNYSNFLLHVIKDTKQKLFNKKIQIYVSIASIFTPYQQSINLILQSHYNAGEH